MVVSLNSGRTQIEDIVHKTILIPFNTPIGYKTLFRATKA